jgi:anti-sigma factor RsiW
MQSTPSPLNEKLIVQYLLGELTEEQRNEIEDQAFQSKEYMQEILNVESDLIDDYVRGEIPANRRSEFEKYFLASAERRRKVEFARALSAVTDEIKSETSHSEIRLSSVKINSLGAFIRSLNPVGAIAFAAAALILITGAAWLITDVIKLRSQLNQLQAERKTQEQQRKELEQQLADERSRDEALAAQLGQPKEEDVPVPVPQPKQEQSERSSILALTLLPGLSRGEATAPKLTLKPEVQTVRLNIVIDPQDVYPKFGAEVYGPTGERLSSQTVRGGRKMIGLSLAAKGLQVGRYEVGLKGIRDGASTELGYYYFEVRK